jgi:hypothetical protein
VPGYEPFLLCDFHVHTRWSDGRLSLRDTIDLYGRTEKFDVIAILVEDAAARREGVVVDSQGALRKRRRGADTLPEGLVESGRHSVDQIGPPGAQPLET